MWICTDATSSYFYEIIFTVKAVSFARFAKSVGKQSHPIEIPIFPIPTFILGVAIEGIIGHQSLLQKLGFLLAITAIASPTT